MTYTDQFKTGQVWRRHGSPFGDIDSYQVGHVSARCVELINCATLNRVWVASQGQADSFTFDCEKISDTPRWPELQA